MSRFTMPSFLFSPLFSCYCCYYLFVGYLAMRQAHITTGFPTIIGYYCCIEARTRKRERERERIRKLSPYFRTTNTYPHSSSSSIRCWFFFVFSLHAKKDQRKRYCLFFFSLYMFFGRIIALVYLFLSS